MIEPPVTLSPCGLYPNKCIDLWSRRLYPQFLLPSVFSPYLPEGSQQHFIIQVESQPFSVQSLLGWTGQPFSMVMWVQFPCLALNSTLPFCIS